MRQLSNLRIKIKREGLSSGERFGTWLGRFIDEINKKSESNMWRQINNSSYSPKEGKYYEICQFLVRR